MRMLRSLLKRLTDPSARASARRRAACDAQFQRLSRDAQDVLIREGSIRIAVFRAVRDYAVEESQVGFIYEDATYQDLRTGVGPTEEELRKNTICDESATSDTFEGAGRYEQVWHRLAARGIPIGALSKTVDQCREEGFFSVHALKYLMDKAITAFCLTEGDYYTWSPESGIRWVKAGEGSGEADLTCMLAVKHSDQTEADSPYPIEIGLISWFARRGMRP